MRKRKAQSGLSEELIKKPYNPTLFSLPDEIHSYLIASYLTNQDLLAYAQTHKAALRFLLPELERRNLTVSTSGTHTLILCEGLLYGSGEGISLLFNQNEDAKGDEHLTFGSVPTPAWVKQVVAGENFTIILTVQNLVYVTGDYSQGYFTGIERASSPFQQIKDILGKVLQLTASANHTLIYTDQGLFAWGNNAYGQSSLTTTNLVRLDNIPGTILQLAAADNHLLVLSSEGLFVWGDNKHGQLGIGDNQNRTCFTRVTGITGTIQQIATGKEHSILLANNKVYTTGYNTFGQLGLNDTNARNSFTEVQAEFGIIREVLAGSEHSLVLTNSALYGCGYNEYGQLGTYYLVEDEITCKGYDQINHFVQLKNLPNPIYQVYTGPYHLFVLTAKGIYVCGDNMYGTLGRESVGSSELSIDMKLLEEDLPKSIKDNLQFRGQFIRLIECAKKILPNEALPQSTLTYSPSKLSMK